jgi:hypothetical protein
MSKKIVKGAKKLIAEYGSKDVKTILSADLYRKSGIGQV